MRQQLLKCFKKSLQAIHGKACVTASLAQHPLKDRPCMVVAIGKAAQAMAEGAQQALGDNLLQGLLITKHQHSEPHLLSSVWSCHEASHPVPDQTSIESGQKLLDFLETNKTSPILFLISGGTSALLEVLPEYIDLSQWQKLNSWLLASGMDIGEINAIRKKVSAVKGGKLLHYLGDREVHALLISDVPGDQLAVIGSGLLFSKAQQGFSINENWPAWIRQLLDESMNAASSTVDLVVPQVSAQIVASNRMALLAAAECFRTEGLHVHLHDEFLQGNAEQVGQRLADFLLNDAAAGVHLWGGETTMVLPEQPGKGGRNQHLALSAARRLAGDKHIMLLAAGTDGSDGPTEDAGAIIDGETLERGSLAGLNVNTCLQQADSGSFLEAAGDLLHTGPTGTNVMDLVIAIKTP